MRLILEVRFVPGIHADGCPNECRSDQKCMTILKHLRAAMGPHSIVIIDDIVVQTGKSNWKQVNHDITMLAALSAMERTEEQWRALLGAANLKLKKIVGYDHESGDSIIVGIPTWK